MFALSALAWVQRVFLDKYR